MSIKIQTRNRSKNWYIIFIYLFVLQNTQAMQHIISKCIPISKFFKMPTPKTIGRLVQMFFIGSEIRDIQKQYEFEMLFVQMLERFLLSHKPESDVLLQKVLAINPEELHIFPGQIIINNKIYETKKGAFIIKNNIYIPENLYDTLSSSCMLEQYKVLQMLNHENNHRKNKDFDHFLHKYRWQSYLISLITLSVGGKIVKKTCRTIQTMHEASTKAYMQSCFYNYTNVIAKDVLTKLYFSKDAKNREKKADNMMHDDPIEQYRLLYAAKEFFNNDVQDMYSNLRYEQYASEIFIAFKELFSSHPDTEKRIQWIKKDLEQISKHPEVQKRINNESMWKD